MLAGQLREQVIIYVPSKPVLNVAGGWTQDALATSIVYARIVQSKAKQVLENNQLVYKQAYTITIRYNANFLEVVEVDAGDKIGKILINSVVADERNTILTLHGYNN